MLKFTRIVKILFHLLCLAYIGLVYWRFIMDNIQPTNANLFFTILICFDVLADKVDKIFGKVK